MGLYTFIKDEVYLPSDPDTPYKLQIVVDKINEVGCLGYYSWDIAYDLTDLQGKVCAAGSCGFCIPVRDINESTFSAVSLFKKVLTRIDSLVSNDCKIKLAEERALAELKTWDGRI